MKLSLKINRHTSTEELVALTALFIGLSGGRTKPDTLRTGELGEIQTGPTIVFSPPLDAAELNEPELSVIVPPTSTVEQELRGEQAPKRRRRTKEEIKAEAHASQGEPLATGPFYWSHPESDSFGMVDTRAELDMILTSDPCTVEITKEDYAELTTKAEVVENPTAADPHAATQTAPETTSGAQEAAATASPSDDKTYTAPEVQKLASVVANAHGPDVVKDKIAELGGTRIADLDQAKINELGKFLSNVK